MLSASIDHLVITASSLDAGKEMVYESLGVWPQGGGEHARMGTHNLLLRLGPKAYLEVIAINPASPVPDRSRWFELDGKAQNRSPVLSTWVARCDDIHLARATFSSSHGDIESMSRGDLRWSITIPQDGYPIEGGLVPNLIQWDVPFHPCDRLPDQQCRFEWMEAAHPNPAKVAYLLRELGLEKTLKLTPSPPYSGMTMCAYLRTPAGAKTLMS